MIIIYNILQILLLLILGPFLAVWVVVSAKYRHRIPNRLGFGLGGMISDLPLGPRVWIHALSVGEMASVRPLLEVLRREMPEVVVILSATTRSGEEYARGLTGLADCIVPFPLDFYWVVKRFVRLLRPDLFVLVETDFWPNLLSHLNRKKVRCLLANGRVTRQSMARYHRFRFLFTPVFSSFWRISMQMADDAIRLVQLGVNPEKIVVCGNLKYDMAEIVSDGTRVISLADITGTRGLILVAGSTHNGEEEIVLDAFVSLLTNYPFLFLVIAPRDVKRALEIVDLCVDRGLHYTLRTGQKGSSGQVLILDTLGELVSVYRLADIAFVGGSLVDQGGHNPLEPAFYSVPVLFGDYMADFAEISRDLVAVGGAFTVTDETFRDRVEKLLASEGERKRMGRCAGDLVMKHRGAAQRLLGLIREALW
ncbi:MAG: 3-deoxy-D-manno-octulosonic acid transferase [Proteobacteria bacterium]|nr:3-deoxy-D-manno-octulosonic acid transferase [Desulfobulbaceae bacterium]MBU4151372.1 3-deoxy-D-manno-octulosonic acid transferase [Pseudomonadota bacterium]